LLVTAEVPLSKGRAPHRGTAAPPPAKGQHTHTHTHTHTHAHPPTHKHSLTQNTHKHHQSCCIIELIAVIAHYLHFGCSWTRQGQLLRCRSSHLSALAR